MTAVATFSVQGLPLVLGDLLISGGRLEDSGLVLPTVENWQRRILAPAGPAPQLLAQKLMLLGPELVVGWAGDQIAARMAIRALKEKRDAGEVTIERLPTILEEIQRDAGSLSFGLTGFLIQKPEIHQFWFQPADHIDSLEPYGRVALLGSGAPAIRRILSTPLEGRAQDTTDKRAVAISSALWVAGVALLDEILAPNALNDLYGAGYEIAYLTAEGFKKLDDVTYIFWVANRVENKIQLALNRILKYQYVSDLLHISAVRPSPERKPGGPPLMRAEGMIMRPILWQPPKEGLPHFEMPDLNSSHTVSMFACLLDGQPKTAYTRVEYREVTSARDIVFSEERVSVNDRYLAGLVEHVGTVLNELAG